MRFGRLAALRFLFGAMLFGSLFGCGGDSSAPSGNGSPKVGLGSAAPSGDLKRIIILTNGNSPFWDAAAAGARDAEQEMSLAAEGFRVVVDRNDGKVESQIDKLRSYAGATDIAAVGVSVLDAQNEALEHVAGTELRADARIERACGDHSTSHRRYRQGRRLRAENKRCDDRREDGTAQSGGAQVHAVIGRQRMQCCSA